MSKSLSIKDVAQEVGLSAHTLRYYEKIGLLGPVARDASGRRAYAEADLRRLDFLQKLRSTGMSIRQMTEYVGLVEQGEPTLSLRREMLEQHATKVEEELRTLHLCLDVIRHKIDMYKEWESEQCKNGN